MVTERAERGVSEHKQSDSLGWESPSAIRGGQKQGAVDPDTFVA